jgi:hypothetical protein
MSGRPSNFPKPRIISREALHIRVRRISDPDMSYGSIAAQLNRVYRHYNGGCRTPYGVYFFIKRKITESV